MTGRSVPEWIGKTPDSKVPTSVRTRVFLTHNGICHISGRPIRVGEAWELEHITPLSMGGEHRETNMAPALVQPHREKSAKEATARAKADRVRAKHLGTWPKSKTPLRSRGFEKTRSQAGTTGADLSPGRNK
jgi:5-methylcytosine-specific restriction protein A